MIRHFAGLAEVVEDVAATVDFYRDVLGLKVKYDEDFDYGDVELDGVLHFGIWSRKAAAETAFGDASRADEIPLGFVLGFEVDSVDDATAEAAANGLDFVQGPKTEPWGQVTSRFHMPSGQLAELSETPWARRITQMMAVEKAEEKDG